MDIRGQIDELSNKDSFDEGTEGFENEPIVTPEAIPAPLSKDKVTEPVSNPFDPGDDSNDDGELKNTPTQNKIIGDLLKLKGIADPSKVLYENDKGDVEEKDFYDLPYEDQLNILSQQEDSSGEFNEEELFYIQQARDNGLSLTDLIKYYLTQNLEEYTKSQQANYLVADYSDEELYVMDMKLKLGDSITDEEIIKLLEKELEIPDIFKKKVDKLREDYISTEKNEREATENALKTKSIASFKEFGDTMTSLIDNVEDVGGVALEDNDKNEILKFMLEQDVNGSTQFQKLITDPENIFLAAWAILKAQDTFDVLKDHYESLLKTSKKEQTVKTDKGTQATVVRSTPALKRPMDITDLHTF